MLQMPPGSGRCGLNARTPANCLADATGLEPIAHRKCNFRNFRNYRFAGYLADIEARMTQKEEECLMTPT